MEDDYRWMRDKSSPELVAYLEAENAYTLSVMAPTEELQAKLYAEMLSHIKETDESVPYRDTGMVLLCADGGGAASTRFTAAG